MSGMINKPGKFMPWWLPYVCLATLGIMVAARGAATDWIWALFISAWVLGFLETCNRVLTEKQLELQKQLAAEMGRAAALTKQEGAARSLRRYHTRLHHEDIAGKVSGDGEGSEPWPVMDLSGDEQRRG